MQEIAYCPEAVYYEADDYSKFRVADVDDSLFDNDLVLFVAMADQEGFMDKFVKEHPKYHVEKAFYHGYSSMYHLKIN